MMLKKAELLNSVILIYLLFSSCVNNKPDYVGMVSNRFFLGMKIEEFKNMGYGFLDYESSGKEYSVYIKFRDVKSDSIYTITEAYSFNNNSNKLELVEFVLTLNENIINKNNFEDILETYCKNNMYIEKAKVSYSETNYPTLVLTWE